MTPTNTNTGRENDPAVRLDFYIMAYRRMSMVAIFAMAFGIASILAATAIYIFRPPSQNYAITSDGRLVPMTPLTEGLNPTIVTNFVSKSLTSAFTFDFKNYNTQLSETKSLFTDTGYNAFMDAIAPLVEEAKANKFVATATIVSVPVIVKTGVVGGVAKYKIETVLLFEMTGEVKRAAPRKWIIETVIDRVPQTQYPIGLAISRIVAEPAK